MAEPPLIEAAKTGDVKTVKNCLDGGTSADQRSASGDTALAWAAWEGHEEVVRLLLERGADRSLVRDGGPTPLALAEKKGNARMVALLSMPVAPPEATETWAKMGAASVAQVGIYPAIQKKLTAIFNFESRERVIIAENLLTKAETITTPTSFDTLPPSLLEKALEEFARFGGIAERTFVLQGQEPILKPRRDLSPK